MPNNKQNRHVERLSPNEVAAVHVDREYYVNDVPSPYLSRRQASENIEKTRRRQMIISTVLILLLIAAMVAGVGWFVWTTLKPEPTKVVPTYNTATIERMDFVDSIDGTSIVRPIDERGVISEVSGIINEVLVENDKFVEEGEALFVLENASVRETYDKARQALDSAQAEVDKKQAALDAAQKALEEEQNRANGTSGTSSTSTTSETTSSSTSNSSETTSGTTRSTADQQNTTAGEPSNIAINSSRRFVMQASETQTTSNSTTTSSGQNTSALTKAENRVKNAQRELDEINKTFDTIRETFERAEEQFDRLTVRAPIPGTVSDISSVAVVGNQITGSERLCTVSDLSAYLVQQEIPEERVPQVHEGMEAHLSFPNVADLVIVSSVSEVVENEDGTTHLANIVIDNTDERLTKYMACNSSIIVQAIPNTLVVPLEAICVDEQGNTRLNVLLDPTRGINTYVDVNVIATNATQAVVEADNIQCETSVILSDPGAPAQKAPQPEPQPEPEPEPEGEPDQPEEEPEPQPEEEG